jgi:hypothetical protein
VLRWDQLGARSERATQPVQEQPINSPPPGEPIDGAIERRILNEFASKILNEEKLGKVLDERIRNHHPSNFTEMLFHCECDDRACAEMIAVSTEEYVLTHHKTKQFIVRPSHVGTDIEKVTEHFANYSLVEKYFPHAKAESV